MTSTERTRCMIDVNGLARGVGECAEEYATTKDRRFHAQPIACSKRGQIVAVKGIGGFHLVCDATNDDAVAELRKRKARERKPLSVMVPGLAAAEQLCLLDEATCALLVSAARPIVLTARREQVSLSGSIVSRLADVADVFLTHDRAIELRLEDSVVRFTARGTVPLRRSRGYAPLPIRLGFDVGATTLALGGHIKTMFALGHTRTARLGPHFGDLDGYAAFDAWRSERSMHELGIDFDVEECIAHVRRLNPETEIIAVSARRGDELGQWFDWLRVRLRSLEGVLRHEVLHET